MKVSELFETKITSLNEDWGSSDWYPVMRAMEKSIADGHSVEEAANDCAERWHADMGYDDFEDAADRIIAKYKALKGSKKVNEDLSSKLEDAIKMNWLSWSTDEIVAELKRAVKRGQWSELKGKSDEQLEDLVDDAKYGAKNQVDEARAAKGMWVIKNKDGVEKRFKDDESPEAKAWKASSKPKKASPVPKEKYSQEWWDYQEDKDPYSDKVYPGTKIDRDELTFDKLADAFKDAGYEERNVDDYHIQRATEKTIKGVRCAAYSLRVVYVYTKEDDIGVEGDEPVSDSQVIYVARDSKNPKKFVFAGYGH